MCQEKVNFLASSSSNVIYCKVKQNRLCSGNIKRWRSLNAMALFHYDSIVAEPIFVCKTMPLVLWKGLAFLIKVFLFKSWVVIHCSTKFWLCSSKPEANMGYDCSNLFVYQWSLPTDHCCYVWSYSHCLGSDKKSKHLVQFCYLWEKIIWMQPLSRRLALASGNAWPVSW